MDGVRSAAVGDARGIARVHVRGWQAGYAGLIPASVLDALSVDERAEQWRGRIEVLGGNVLVLADDGVVVGFAAVSATPLGEPAAGPDGPGELTALYVDPDRWRAGCGRALHDAAVTRLRDQGVVRAVLWVLERNARARAFYGDHGWRDDGATEVETWAGVDVVARRMVRRLTDEA